MQAEESINDIYETIMAELLVKGESGANPRGSSVKEFYNYSLKLRHAENSIILNKKRGINYAYAAIEMLGLLRHGDKNVEPYTYYNGVMRNYLNPETNTWDGSYATRITIYDQMREMYKILKADPFSRRAVISLYNPEHDFHDYESRDICCTLNLIFSIRNGRLNLTCTMRSNDILLGLPYDLTQFTFLQSVLASWLGLKMGNYYHFTANMHSYDKDTNKIIDIIGNTDPYDVSEMPWQKMQMWDIQDPDETYKEIENFFIFERALRDNPTRLEALWELANLKSEFLKFLAGKIILPFIERKQNRLRKAV